MRYPLSRLAHYFGSAVDAAHAAVNHGATLGHYAGPVDDAAHGITAERAAEVAAEDIGLVYVDAEEGAECIAYDAGMPGLAEITDRNGDLWVVEPGDFIAHIGKAEDECDVGEIRGVSADGIDVEWTGHRETVSAEKLRRVLVFSDRNAAFAAAGLTP